MYAFISGKLDYVGEGVVVIDNNGIGYNIFVSNNVLTALPKVGENIKLITYTQVKEDSFTLYGFLAFEEKKMFEKLININGVGCKIALQILSGIDSTTLAVAIANADISALTRIKGVGKKMAERIILELKEKVDIKELTQADSGVRVALSADINDAITALVSLGIAKSDAYKAVMKASEKTSGTNQLITLALRSMDNQ